MTPFAVFVIAPTAAGAIAATTRAADRGEAGRIGLPGGKLDPGETPVDALIRECAEEGWAIHGVSPNPVHRDTVDGREVWWFRASSATPLPYYKEQGRISPVHATPEQVRASGYGNDRLPRLPGE